MLSFFKRLIFQTLLLCKLFLERHILQVDRIFSPTMNSVSSMVFLQSEHLFVTGIFLINCNNIIIINCLKSFC
ncbi:unnamed protein product [Rhizophagus irregularis]|nr:unnamed protein product [Rhizophagus irregularis]